MAFQMWFRCGSEVWLFRCGSDGDVIRMGLFGAPTESEPRFLSGLHGCPATGGVQSASLDATPLVRRASARYQGGFGWPQGASPGAVDWERCSHEGALEEIGEVLPGSTYSGPRLRSRYNAWHHPECRRRRS